MKGGASAQCMDLHSWPRGKNSDTSGKIQPHLAILPEKLPNKDKDRVAIEGSFCP